MKNSTIFKTLVLAALIGNASAELHAMNTAWPNPGEQVLFIIGLPSLDPETHLQSLFIDLETGVETILQSLPQEELEALSYQDHQGQPELVSESFKLIEEMRQHVEPSIFNKLVQQEHQRRNNKLINIHLQLAYQRTLQIWSTESIQWLLIELQKLQTLQLIRQLRELEKLPPENFILLLESLQQLQQQETEMINKLCNSNS